MAQTAIVHVLDDDQFVLKAVARLLASAGHEARTHSCAQQFLDNFDPAAYGCIVLDRSMPDVDGHAVQNWLSIRRVSLPVIFLTGEGDISSSVRAIRDGAVDYLTKPVEAEALLQTVERALVLDRERRVRRIEADGVATRLASLTPREREVLEAVTSGRLNKQIAHDLDIVEKTVKVHRARVMRKMGARTLAELVTMVVRHRELR